MVSSWDLKQVVKKKYTVPPSEKEDWITFTKNLNNISSKEEDLIKRNYKTNSTPKLDLHGFSLAEAENVVKKFITDSFDKDFRKIIIITGKGSHSKTFDNPYVSEKSSTLKNFIPEYIKNDNILNSKIIKMSQASQNKGGEGAIYVLLKKNNKVKE